MTPTSRAFARLAGDVARVFGDRFVALVAYGANASVAFASAVQPGDLEALSALAEVWRRDGLATPLTMTPDEFRRSVDAFPLEYQAILDQHTVVAGTPPFQDVRIDPDDLRRACETQARSHLIHLRQGWIDHGAHEAELEHLVVRSAGPFRALLSSLARLHGRPHHSDAELAAFATSTIGVPSTVVEAVLALAGRHDDAAASRPRMDEYLHATERLWSFVDTWRAS